MNNYTSKIHETISVSFLIFFLLFIPLKGAYGAFVKDRHGFIGGTNLDLTKVGRDQSATFGTIHGRPIDIFPGRRSPEYIQVLVLVVTVFVHHATFPELIPMGQVGHNGHALFVGDFCVDDIMRWVEPLLNVLLLL